MTDTANDVSTVSVTVNGVEIEATPGELLIDACERTGTYIPRFCYHPRMKPVGMCRMCLVEVDAGRGPGLQPSCMLPVSDGMRVETESDLTKKAQDGVLEFLLANHPLDCPVCDKGGECPLQDQTMAFGPGETRFVEEKRHYEKPIPISDTVYLDRERCILCDRCTRFADDVAGDTLIHFMDRGNNTQVNTFPDEPFASYFSGNTVQICPVGALTAAPYRFKARPWDLEETVSTAWTDSVGSRVTVQSSRNQVVRLLGVDADAVNWGWLSDKERFAFEALNSDRRLGAPQLRQPGGELVDAGWAPALAAVTDALKQTPASRVGLIGGARLTNESQYAWTKLFKGGLGTDNVDAQLGDGLPAQLVLSLRRASINEACRPGGTVILCGPDLKEDLGALYLRIRHAVVNDGVTLIEITPTRTGLSGIAAHSLHPAAGEVAALASALVAAQRGEAQGAAGVSAEQVAQAAAALSGPVTVVLGRPSIAESVDSVTAAALALTELPDVAFLSALRRGNVHGALDMGMAPGLLPGRTPLSAGTVSEVWANTPSEPGLDTEGMLRAAAAGELDVLVLLGADPLSDFPDRQLARKALEAVTTVVAIESLPNPSTLAYADVVLPAAMATEVDGTFTNLEGRVSVSEQKVTPPGTARADWMIASEIARRLGNDLGFGSTADIRAEMVSVSPLFAGLTEEALIEHRIEGVLVTGSSISLPSASAPETPHHDAYSLRLVTGRRMYDAGTMVQASSSSAGLAAAVAVRLGTADFERLGCAEGTTVRVASAQGELLVPVVHDRGVPTGSAALAANAPGSPANTLIDCSTSVTEVRVERP